MSGVCVPSGVWVDDRGSSAAAVDDRRSSGVCVPSAADAADEETRIPSRVSFCVDDLTSGVCSACRAVSAYRALPSSMMPNWP